ncbi:MAG: UDP-2,3-diacylglucosamine diphosphatase LpxI [Pseudomonadota bacterium]
MAAKLAILAGSGPLPAQVVAAAQAHGREVFVLAFEGETDPGLLGDLAHRWLPVGAIGRAIETLHEEQAEEVLLIGPVRRPALSSLGLDRRGLQLLAKLGLRGRGDDQLLRLVVEELQSEGFRVIGADELIEEALAPCGPITRLTPDRQAMRDIELGLEVTARLGDLDIGQAAVVQQGQVLGVEAAEGTDALLARCVGLRGDGRGGVLVKVKKPGQERRADLPTIGPSTVKFAAEARLVGIAVQADHCLIVDRPQVVKAANRKGLFVIGVTGQ